MPLLQFSRRSLAVSDFGFVNPEFTRRARSAYLLGALIVSFQCSPFATHLNIARAAEAAPAATPPAAPVTFAQRWVAGQKWNYEAKMDGKITLRLPANAGTPIAGMELKDIAYQSSARLMLDVLEADANGVGTIAFRTDRLRLTAEMGLGALEIENNEASIYVGETLYGQPQKLALDDLKNPREAMRFNARGHFEGISPIETGGIETGAAPPAAPAPDAKPGFDMKALVQTLDPKILPALWPDHAVSPGDTWSSEVLLPIKTDDAKSASAGSLQFSYVGPETDVLKHALQRVHVEGTIKISEEQAALLGAQAGAPQDAAKGKVLGSSQKINGDIWFDNALGQVRRVDAKLQTYTASEAFAEVKGKQQDNSSWFIFDGRVRMDLRDSPAATKPPTR